MKKTKGFASMEKERVRELGRKGGSAKNPNKGFGSHKDKVKELGRKGAEVRWGKHGKD